jgi:hypothetical protein
VPEARLRQTMELSVGGDKQGVTRLRIAALYPSEEICELAHRVHWHCSVRRG